MARYKRSGYQHLLHQAIAITNHYFHAPVQSVAYKIAGGGLDGKLSETFLVLKDYSEANFMRRKRAPDESSQTVQRKAAQGMEKIAGVHSLSTRPMYEGRPSGGGGKRGNETLSPLEHDSRGVILNVDKLRSKGYLTGVGATGLTPGMSDMELA